MASTGLPLESKLLLELTRGAALAVHAAAGSARGHRAARLLRAAEGLCRSAAALLQLPPAGDTSKQGKDDNNNGKGTSKKDKKDKTSEKDRTAAGDKDEAQQAPGAQRRRPRRRRAPAAAPPGSPDADFDDSWADGVVAFGPAPAPLGAPLLALPALPAPATAEATPQPRSPPPASRTGSRSPRRLSAQAARPAPETDASAAPPPALLAGCLATLQRLVKRPDLERTLVELSRFDASVDRWVCLTSRGEQLCIRPSNLLPVPENGQRFQRLRFASGG